MLIQEADVLPHNCGSWIEVRNLCSDAVFYLSDQVLAFQYLQQLAGSADNCCKIWVFYVGELLVKSRELCDLLSRFYIPNRED